MHDFSPSSDRLLGALLGTAIGDALGMPVEGFSHQNVRTFYKGIKEYRADERRGELEAGQWTVDTQGTFALVRALTAHPTSLSHAAKTYRKELEELELRRFKNEASTPTNGVAVTASPFGVLLASRTTWSTETVVEWIERLFGETHGHPGALAAGVGQAYAVATALGSEPVKGAQFVLDVARIVEEAEVQVGATNQVSRRLLNVSAHLGDFPLDLQDHCNGTGVAADESFPFAIAMFARGPKLAEASLLSAINVGGDANSVGAMLGALLGAKNGWRAFPATWRTGLEDVEELASQAQALMARL